MFGFIKRQPSQWQSNTIHSYDTPGPVLWLVLVTGDNHTVETISKNNYIHIQCYLQVGVSVFPYYLTL